MDDVTAVKKLAAIYPRPPRRDPRSALRIAVDGKRDLIVQMIAHGASLRAVAEQLRREGITTRSGEALDPNHLSTLIHRCRILEGEPDPAAPRTPGSEPDDGGANRDREGDHATT
jgi:hypothetical protein